MLPACCWSRRLNVSLRNSRRLEINSSLLSSRSSFIFISIPCSPITRLPRAAARQTGFAPATSWQPISEIHALHFPSLHRVQKLCYQAALSPPNVPDCLFLYPFEFRAAVLSPIYPERSLSKASLFFSCCELTQRAPPRSEYS